MSTKLLIIGGVAGGATAAARARRIDETAQIIVFERGEFVSFANCGLPYHIGGDIEERDSLLVATKEMLTARFNIDIRTFSEVTAIDRANKQVVVKNLQTGATYTQSYDKLILSPGAAPIKPPLTGINLDTIFSLRNIPDMDRIKDYVDKKQPRRAVVVGGGFIGLEMAEQLVQRGVAVTVVEMLKQVMAPIDYEMAEFVHVHLQQKGVDLVLEDGVQSFQQKDNKTVVTTSTGKEIDCDIVILSIGVKPENDLAKAAGLEIGNRGGIKTDEYMRTCDPDIFAVGDAIEVVDFVSGNKTMVPLAGPANRQGRIAADNALGRTSTYKGTQGTSIVRVFDLVIAATGNNEKTLQGKPYRVSYTHTNSHAGYFPGAKMLAVKLLFHPDDGRILGAQVVGEDGVDKRIDVLATAIHARMTVYDLEELELAYAPPYGSAKDPVNIAGFVAANILKGDVQTVNWNEIENLPSQYVLLDVRNKDELLESGELAGSVHIPLPDLRSRLQELDKQKVYVPFCAIGLRGYVAARILTQNGFQAKNLSGGYKTYMVGNKKMR